MFYFQSINEVCERCLEMDKIPKEVVKAHVKTRTFLRKRGMNVQLKQASEDRRNAKKLKKFISKQIFSNLF